MTDKQELTDDELDEIGEDVPPGRDDDTDEDKDEEQPRQVEL